MNQRKMELEVGQSELVEVLLEVVEQCEWRMGMPA